MDRQAVSLSCHGGPGRGEHLLRLALSADASESVHPHYRERSHELRPPRPAPLHLAFRPCHWLRKSAAGSMVCSGVLRGNRTTNLAQVAEGGWKSYSIAISPLKVEAGLSALRTRCSGPHGNHPGSGDITVQQSLGGATEDRRICRFRSTQRVWACDYRGLSFSTPTIVRWWFHDLWRMRGAEPKRADAACDIPYLGWACSCNPCSPQFVGNRTPRFWCTVFTSYPATGRTGERGLTFC